LANSIYLYPSLLSPDYTGYDIILKPMKKIVPFITLCLIFFSASAQSVFWSDTFEDAGAPSSGTRTASPGGAAGFSFGGPPATSYFFRTAGVHATDISLQDGASFSGKESSKYWAGEDIDQDLTGTHKMVTWTGINISGRTSLSFQGLFVSKNNALVWEGPITVSGFPADYLIAEYRIDAGAWIQLVGFFSDVPATKRLALDVATGDSIGDGAQLPNATFTNYSANIGGTGTTLDLRFKAFANGSQEEFGIDNFRLLSAILPIDLAAFSAEKTVNGNLVRWSTASETNNSHFNIERSSDQNVFQTIGTIEGIGNSSTLQNYSFLDAEAKGVNYYRLSQVDIDGNIKFSNVVEVSAVGENEMIVYPNPAQNQVTVEVNPGLTIENVQWIDVAGRIVNVPCEVINSAILADVSSLAPGVYYVKVQTNSTFETKSVVIQ
jgi:Secretion system C-terminal sorting domain